MYNFMYFFFLQSYSKSATTSKPGRPRQSNFDVSSECTKKIMVSEIIQTHSTEELSLATRIKLGSAGATDAVVKDRRSL